MFLGHCYTVCNCDRVAIHSFTPSPTHPRRKHLNMILTPCNTLNEVGNVKSVQKPIRKSDNNASTINVCVGRQGSHCMGNGPWAMDVIVVDLHNLVVSQRPYYRPVQGWESTCWGELGIPLLENQKVSWFLGFKVSWFQRFKNPTMFVIGFGPSYQMFISCVLINIDLISKISKILLNGSSGFFGARLFETCRNYGFSNCRV